MPRLRTTVLPLLAVLTALTLTAGACSSDDSSSKKTTTTEASKKTTTTAKEGSSTSTTLSAKEFDAQMSKVESQLDKLSGDVCGPVEVIGSLSTVPTPSDPAQAKRFVAAYASLLEQVAASLPADKATQAAAIRKAAKDVQAEGAAAKYSDSFMSGPKAFTTKEFTAAMQDYQTLSTEKCATTSTTAAP
jgi:hypothetical protein